MNPFFYKSLDPTTLKCGDTPSADWAFYWSIRPEGEGCVAQLSAQHLSENTTYNADEFFISRGDNTIHPQSSGARAFLDSYRGSLELVK